MQSNSLNKAKNSCSLMAATSSINPNQISSSNSLTLEEQTKLESIINRYKPFIKSCTMKDGDGEVRGSVRDVRIVSGIPASSSIERLEILDDEKHILSFKVLEGDHRLRNYRSVTSVNEFIDKEGDVYSIVLESYVVDIPEGNSEEETRMFADTVVKLNLAKLTDLAMASWKGQRK